MFENIKLVYTPANPFTTQSPTLTPSVWTHSLCSVHLKQSVIAHDTMKICLEVCSNKAWVRPRTKWVDQINPDIGGMDLQKGCGHVVPAITHRIGWRLFAKSHDDWTSKKEVDSFMWIYVNHINESKRFIQDCRYNQISTWSRHYNQYCKNYALHAKKTIINRIIDRPVEIKW